MFHKWENEFQWEQSKKLAVLCRLLLSQIAALLLIRFQDQNLKQYCSKKKRVIPKQTNISGQNIMLNCRYKWDYVRISRCPSASLTTRLLNLSLPPFFCYLWFSTINKQGCCNFAMDFQLISGAQHSLYASGVLWKLGHGNDVKECHYT